MKSTWRFTIICCLVCGLAKAPLFAQHHYGGGTVAAGGGHAGAAHSGHQFGVVIGPGFLTTSGSANYSPSVFNSVSAAQNSVAGSNHQMGVYQGGANGLHSNITSGFGTHHPIGHIPTAQYGYGEGNFGQFSNDGQSPTGFLFQGAGSQQFGSNPTASYPAVSYVHYANPNGHHHHHHHQLSHSVLAHDHRHGNWINGNSGVGTTHKSHHSQFGDQPFFWGTNSSAGWGQGALIYSSGYLGYLNPYFSSMDLSGLYNYTQPILATQNNPQVVATPVSNKLQRTVNSAVAAFMRSDYETALDIANRGIESDPDEAVLHEFRALVLFAKGDYQPAAATIHAVLAVGPGWDWTTLISLYRDTSIYTTQLRALEGTVKQNPTDGAIRFLLAYHYLTEGYPDAAARILRRVVDLVPNDQVAVNLLKMVSGSPAQAPTPNVAQPTPDAPTTESSPATVPVAPADIVGTWKATREDGSKFSLTLTEDKRFTWTFASRQFPPESFAGTYSLDNSVISLESRGRGSLVAKLKIAAEDRFNFKALGAPDQDPGLDFSLANRQ